MDLRQGNCLDLMKTLDDNSVDLLICDLPYGETNCKWDNKIDMVQFWKEFKRIRKSKKTACIHFCSTRFGYELIKSWENGFKMDMVWKKRNKTGGLQSRHRPMRNHEMVYFFYEQAPKYNRDKYHKRIHTSVIDKKGGKNEHGFENNIQSALGRKNINNFDPPNPTSVVEEDEPASMFESTKVFIGKRHHQTEKPQDILEFFLKYWTDEDDVVLDPTMGSGSTGVACKKMGRKFIGFELSPEIYEKACARIGE
jgi:site-specific DNA-methyltransferase (adenine-specific)